MEKKQLQGIAFILFGMLLVLFAAVNNTVVPMMDQSIIGPIFSFVLVWLGLILGILGLVLSLSKDHGDK